LQLILKSGHLTQPLADGLSSIVKDFDRLLTALPGVQDSTDHQAGHFVYHTVLAMYAVWSKVC